MFKYYLQFKKTVTHLKNNKNSGDDVIKNLYLKNS